jgi:16S rRNA (adenine1518-N6/adenine1519-N6)-dimethyltransferase
MKDPVTGQSPEHQPQHESDRQPHHPAGVGAIDDLFVPPAPPEAAPALDLTRVATARRLLRRHGVRLNKRFGQHLLVDRAALAQIVSAAELAPGDVVLEVGAGMGVLTVELAQRARRVVAVELEQAILPVLYEVLRPYHNVEVIERNLLEVDPVAAFGDQPYKLVANLPYYITAPTLRHFLESGNAPRRLVIMVQREVARRIVAAGGDLSLLGVSVQFYGRPRIIAEVPAGSFLPPPEVDSAIVRIDVYAQPAVDVTNRDRFFRIVRAGFTQKRKQLHNALSAGFGLRADEARSWLERAGIDPKRRAETLRLEDWQRLYEAFPQPGEAWTAREKDGGLNHGGHRGHEGSQRVKITDIKDIEEEK